LMGYYSPDEEEPADKVYSLINQVGLSEQLVLTDIDSLTIDTEGWADIWSAVIEAYKAGAISNIPVETPSDQPYSGTTYEQMYTHFLQGHAAMIAGNTLMLHLLSSNEDKFEWGLTQMPGSYMEGFNADRIYAINNQSQQMDEAWDIIKFLNGEQVTNKLLNMDGFGNMLGLPLHIELLEKKYDMELSAFYQKELTEVDWNDLPAEFVKQYYSLAKEQINFVINEEKTVSEALLYLQEQLKPIWDIVSQEQKGEIK
jgi:multiple sugar transport system substrate-binding protein